MPPFSPHSVGCGRLGGESFGGSAEVATQGTTGSPGGRGTQRPRWSAGRIALIVLGSLAALIGAGLLAGGGGLLWADQTQRDDDGYLSTPSERFEVSSYAIVSEP